MNLDPEQFPELATEREFPWGPTRTRFELGEPPVELVSNVNIVPRVGNDWLIIRTAQGWGIVGGTLEPGEHYHETIERELLEEAGARLLDFTAFGAFRNQSLSETPYRPHLPHPLSYRIVGVGSVQVLADPANPEDGEEVLEVGVFPLKRACDFLKQRPVDGALLAELYRFAAGLAGEAT